MLESAPTFGPTLSLAERDRRWAGIRALMERRGIEAIVVGSFMGRERLESYLIDDYLDAVVLFPRTGEPTVLSFSPQRTSRALESARRGEDQWAPDYRIGFGGKRVAEILHEKGVTGGQVGIVGFGPTAPGEMEGLLPYGFNQSLTASAPDLSFVDFTRDFTDFMLRKSAEEIALLRYAAQVSEAACLAMIGACTPGATEAAVYAEIMREIYRRGCETRYPHLSLQSGRDNIGWGAPRWTLRAEHPRVLEVGDVVQTEIHTLYGGLEGQVQMSVALDPVDDVLQRCERVARESYLEGVRAVRPGAAFGDVARAMEGPLRDGGCWSKTPLLHTMSFGATGWATVNREQLVGSRDYVIEQQVKPSTRRGELLLEEGMVLELEPNACIGMQRINIGGVVLVTNDGREELSDVPTRVFHKA